MSEEPECVFPKRRAMFAIVLAVCGALSVWLVGMILGSFRRGNSIGEGFLLLLTPLVIFFAIVSALRLRRPGAYLVLDAQGFTLDGLFEHERCDWRRVTRIARSEAHGHGQIEVDLGTDPPQTLLVNANWMCMRPDAALALLTGYWERASDGRRN